MGLGCLSGPEVVPNGLSVFKLELPRVIMELDKSLNQSPQGGLEKIDYTSSNGPVGN